MCAAYDREVYQKMGGFTERAIFNEDMIYAGTMVQNGYTVVYAADARVYHSHNYSGRQQFHRNFDLGVSQAEHPEIFEGVPSEGEGIRLADPSTCLAERNEICGIFSWKKVQKTSAKNYSCVYHESLLLEQKRIAGKSIR